MSHGRTHAVSGAMDPASDTGAPMNQPRKDGVDSRGEPVRLGETDSSGYLVGWIDQQGLAWESRAEAQIAACSGAFLEAFRAWNRAGGVLGTRPDPAEFAARYCGPQARVGALAECELAVALEALATPGLARRARDN